MEAYFLARDTSIEVWSGAFGREWVRLKDRDQGTEISVCRERPSSCLERAHHGRRDAGRPAAKSHEVLVGLGEHVTANGRGSSPYACSIAT
jgi:hypothetical protein